MTKLKNKFRNKFRDRKKYLDDIIKNKTKRQFNNKLVVIGSGGIGTSVIPLLREFINIPLENITIIDKLQYAFKNIDPNIKKINVKITKDNYEKILIQDLKLGQDDIIIDASYDINTEDMYILCNKYGISYTNSAIETWELEKMDPKDETFESRFKVVEAACMNDKKKCNFVVSMGCNPGNVSIWALYALERINKIKHNYKYTNYADLAKKLGLKTIHISENDNQIHMTPKKPNTYLNTWSGDGESWYDEAFHHLELSWGTHEKENPANLNNKISSKYEYIVDQKGLESWAKTYTPISKEMKGMLIRHEECYTLAKSLTLKNNMDKVEYKPSCYYIYKPCKASMESLEEVVNNNMNFQDNAEMLIDNIKNGMDELGCTLFFEDGEVYWVGSLLDIKEARKLFDNKYKDIINSTILQVLAGYMGSMFHIIDLMEKKDYRGFILPEHMPIKKFVKWTRPILGKFGLTKVKDWPKNSNKSWQFSDFYDGNYSVFNKK
jgi:homospermidine synthase